MLPAASECRAQATSRHLQRTVFLNLSIEEQVASKMIYHSHEFEGVHI